jgi:hypothetical protein
MKGVTWGQKWKVKWQFQILLIVCFTKSDNRIFITMSEHIYGIRLLGREDRRACRAKGGGEVSEKKKEILAYFSNHTLTSTMNRYKKLPNKQLLYRRQRRFSSGATFRLQKFKIINHRCPEQVHWSQSERNSSPWYPVTTMGCRSKWCNGTQSLWFLIIKRLADKLQAET